jgi:two-component system CheB/CheR fusion protein
VVVGSSAGGIEALSELVSTLPEDLPVPVVIAEHFDPERESYLEEILSRRSPLPVKTVKGEDPLRAGTVYVVPSNRHVSITDSHVGLSENSSGRPMPSVDLLMSSAAEVFGERLIAVVLSGTGSDGTEGATPSTGSAARS